MASYQKSNLAWQLQQTGQNLREWLGWQRDRLWGQAPDLDLPQIDNWQWWEALLLHGLLWLVIAVAIAIIWGNRQTWRHYWSQLQAMQIRPPLASDPASQPWGDLAQHSAQQGDYAQACRYLYLASLQTLHDRQLIGHAPARTDREYALLVEGLPQAAAYQTLLNLHQQLCFGQGSVSSQQFQRCQQAFDLIRLC